MALKCRLLRWLVGAVCVLLSVCVLQAGRKAPEEGGRFGRLRHPQIPTAGKSHGPELSQEWGGKKKSCWETFSVCSAVKSITKRTQVMMQEE